jgi:hypothetical protein
VLWICNGFNAESGSSILDQSVSGSRGFDNQNCKISSLKNLTFYQKYLFLGLHEDVQATEEASSPQKRTSSFKTINFFTFSFFGSFFPTWIWIKPVKINALWRFMRIQINNDLYAGGLFSHPPNLLLLPPNDTFGGRGGGEVRDKYGPIRILSRHFCGQ